MCDLRRRTNKRAIKMKLKPKKNEIIESYLTESHLDQLNDHTHDEQQEWFIDDCLQRAKDIQQEIRRTQWN